MQDISSPRLRPLVRTLCLVPLLAMVLATGGCNIIAWFAHGVADGERKYQVDAQYLDLQNKRIAVLVGADEYTLFQSPGAPLRVCRAVSRMIAEHVAGAELVPPQDVVDFQRANPYWTAVPYSELVSKLGVDRLVIIDLIEYRTHEPGNPHVLMGLIAGQIGVVEAEADDPDRPAFRTTVRAQFPEEEEVGLVNSNMEDVELGMLVTFARDAAGLFYDHEVTK